MVQSRGRRTEWVLGHIISFHKYIVDNILYEIYSNTTQEQDSNYRMKVMRIRLIYQHLQNYTFLIHLFYFVELIQPFDRRFYSCFCLRHHDLEEDPQKFGPPS